MKTTEKVLISVAVLGVVGAAAFVLVKFLNKKKGEKAEREASEFRKANPYKPLSEGQLENISKSFSKSLEKRLEDFGKPKTQPTPFAQSGGFSSPSLLNTQSSIFQPTNQPLGTINFKPRYLNAVGQFGIAGI